MKMISNKYLALFGLTLAASFPAAQAVDFGAFGDISYQGDTQDNSANHFAVGQFDLYGTQKIDPKTRAFFEIVFEDPGDGYVLDVERLNLTRDLTPNFSVSMGRYHNPIGYWNTAYHHGAIIQDTVLRPTFLDFEDGEGAILPTHIIGVMGAGKVSMASGDLKYMLTVGNGSSINTDTTAASGRSEIDVHITNDSQDKKMVVGNATFKMSKLPLEFGVFALHDPFSESGSGGYSGVGTKSDLISMRVMGGYFRYAAHGLDVTGETYNFENEDKSPVTKAGKNKASAYYVQAGYRVTDKFKTIYRFENVDFLSKDPYFQYLGTPEGSRHVVDLRYDLDDTNALKFEVARFQSTDTNKWKDYTFYALQWAFLML
jgi:hypothetical protein